MLKNWLFCIVLMCFSVYDFCLLMWLRTQFKLVKNALKCNWNLLVALAKLSEKIAGQRADDGNEDTDPKV